MDGLTTPYEDESATEFMECSVCDVSLRGLNLYKIHATTPGHLKKEDVAVAGGHMVREQIVPKFNDILQYVDFLKLDEPIIGLSFLEEVPSTNVDQYIIGPRYTCTLCNSTTYLPEMIHHVIGRKHRQKYIETKRPDLVSWDKHSVMMQTGKMIRARAEIIARQDGSGRPKTIKKMENAGNLMTRVPPWQRQNEDPQNASGQRKWKQEFQESDRGSFMPNPPSGAPFIPAESRPTNAAGGRQTTNPWDRQKVDDWERDPRQGKSLDLDYRLDNSVPQTRRVELHKETQRGWDQPVEGYTTYREQETKNDLLTEDGRRQFQPPRPDYQPQYPDYQTQYPDSQTQYPDSQTPRPDSQTPRLDSQTPRPDSQTPRLDFQTPRLDSQPQRLDYQSQSPDLQGVNQRWFSDKDRDVKLGTNMPGAPTKNVRLPSDKPSEHFRDYNHGMRQAESFSAGPTNFEAPREDSKSLSAIPEPFRRFMSGPAGDEASSRPKRKSRFSDATPEEVAVAKRIFNAGPPVAKLTGPLESGNGTFQQETRRAKQYPDGFSQLQQNSPTLPQMSSQHSYEGRFREESNFRRAEGGYGREGNGGGRDWHNARDGQQQGRREPGDLNRNRYEAGFAQREMYTAHPDERAQWADRFQGGQRQFQQRDLQPFSQGFFDSRSPPFDLERPVGIHQYSKSLEKFTSTILEFMSRN